MTFVSNLPPPAKPVSPSPRRWLHLWLPRLSIDRVRRGPAPPKPPFALIARHAKAQRIEALDETAEALGLTLGSPLAAARARVPDLAVLDADPAADHALLVAVGEVCRRYTPAFALSPPDGVHLDITGLERLFPSEAGLVADLSRRMGREGFSVRIGLGRTLGLAWALARHGDPHVKTLRNLPVDALRLDAESLGVLHRLGLRKVGQILDLPRPALARRLGEEVLHRLDETLGQRGAALDLAPEPAVFYAEHRLAEPILLEEQVLKLCRWLAERLAVKLETRGLGGRRFALDLFRVDGAVKRLCVPCGRPLRAPAAVAALFAERLAVLNEGLEAAFGFDLLRLTAENVEPLQAAPRDFLGAADPGDMASLLDRLAIRLGPAAVHALAPAPESRLPERAVRRLAPMQKTAAWTAEAAAAHEGAALRPFTLFSPPQPITVIAGVPEDPPQHFQWRRLSHRIVRAEGPERIAFEWWTAPEPADGADGAKPAADGLLGDPAPDRDRTLRDYYRIEDEQGRRFWVFREGAYGEGAETRWFLHGLLA